MKSDFKKIIADLNIKISIFREELQISIIEKYSYIVEVGALTVSTVEDGKIALANTAYPTQFTLQVATEISKINFRANDGRGLYGKVYFRNDWYRSKIANIEETIRLLNQQQTPS